MPGCCCCCLFVVFVVVFFTAEIAQISPFYLKTDAVTMETESKQCNILIQALEKSHLNYFSAPNLFSLHLYQFPYKRSEYTFSMQKFELSVIPAP